MVNVVSNGLWMISKSTYLLQWYIKMELGKSVTDWFCEPNLLPYYKKNSHSSHKGNIFKLVTKKSISIYLKIMSKTALLRLMQANVCVKNTCQCSKHKIKFEMSFDPFYFWTPKRANTKSHSYLSNVVYKCIFVHPKESLPLNSLALFRILVYVLGINPYQQAIKDFVLFCIH